MDQGQWTWEKVREMLGRDQEPSTPVPGVDIADVGRLDIMNLSFEVMQSTLTSYKLAGYPPDVLVEIPKASARTFEFHRAPELIELGRRRTEAALDTLDEHVVIFARRVVRA